MYAYALPAIHAETDDSLEPSAVSANRIVKDTENHVSFKEIPRFLSLHTIQFNEEGRSPLVVH